MINWQPGMTVASVEREVILSALQFYGGNKTKTADALDIALRTLQNKLHEYGVMDGKAKLQRSAEEIKRNKEQGLQATTGGHLESSGEVPTEQSVPLRQRKEV